MDTNSTTAGRRLAIPTGDGLLRLALRLDAVVTGANGAAYLALAGPLADLFEVPAGFLRGTGAFLVAFAVAVWLVGSRESIPRPAVVAVIAANLAWAVASVAFIVFDAFDPVTAGAVWTGMQAAVVVLFADLQLAGLRRAARRD
jgi:hypothetical protein